MTIHIGSAGWALNALAPAPLLGSGTHLERYARQFNSVEINSSFYRPHRPTTYARWAASTPPEFRFAVKAPKQITHENRLVGCEVLVEKFVGEATCLGEKLGAVLIQLPPSLPFEPLQADAFFAHFRTQTSAPLVCEPRHASWFTEAGDELLVQHGVGRVAADPAPVSAAASPGGTLATRYRLHGSPRMYYSSYDDDFLDRLAGNLMAAEPADVWCIFDNTAEGAALTNAIRLQETVVHSTAANVTT